MPPPGNASRVSSVDNEKGLAVEPRISIITLGVTDLARSVEFYRDGLGLPLVDENTESIAFFQSRGTWLALYPRESLAADAGVATEGSGFSGVTLAHNVRTREEVDALLDGGEGRARCSGRSASPPRTRRPETSASFSLTARTTASGMPSGALARISRITSTSESIRPVRLDVILG